LQQSDYLTQFLDVAIQDLSKPASSISKEKVQALLDVVIRSSHHDAQTDNIRDSIKVQLDGMSLFEKLLKINSVTGMDMNRYMNEARAGSLFGNEFSKDKDKTSVNKQLPLLGKSPDYRFHLLDLIL
jgi:hypothetical protein